ncbi:transglutaminase family protein, partial [Acidobacteriota bacterium]
PSPSRQALKGRFFSKWGMATILSIALLGVSTVGLAFMLRNIERAFLRISAGGLSVHLPDFTGASSVGGVMRIERHSQLRMSDAIIAAVESPGAPGYFRTQVMTKYTSGNWKASRPESRSLDAIGEADTQRRMFMLAEIPEIAGPGSALAGTDSTVSGGSILDIKLLTDFHGTVLIPYESVQIASEDPVGFSITEGSIILCDMPSQLARYQAFVSEPHDAPAFGTGEVVFSMTPGTRAEDLAADVENALDIPDEVKQALKPLAHQVAGEEPYSPLHAAQRVQDFFQTTFEYSYDVDLAEEGDPVVDFVLNRRPAYCEYYAAGMALTLRSLGIPARVAGGFVVKDYNDIAGRWIIRKSDAHAWCEVYDEETKRWIAFDGTPPAVTEPVSRTSLAAFFGTLKDWVRLRADDLIIKLRMASLKEWAQSAIEFVKILAGKPIFWVLLGFAVSLLFFRKMRRIFGTVLNAIRNLHRESTRADDKEIEPVTQELQRLFDKVAGVLDLYRIPIRPNETVEDYLERLDGADQTGAKAERRSVDHPRREILEAVRRFVSGYAKIRFKPRAASPPSEQDLALIESLRRQAGGIVKSA